MVFYQIAHLLRPLVSMPPGRHRPVCVEDFYLSYVPYVCRRCVMWRVEGTEETRVSCDVAGHIVLYRV